MQCRGCDYPLWNLPPGPCPECGLAFKPIDYEFVPASVAFCCPVCDQAYYGTSFKGHLVPARFKCLGCATKLSMDLMVVRPAEDRPPSKQLKGIPPCMQQGRWVITKWFGTLGWSLGMVGVLISQIPAQRSMGLAWKFFLPLLLVVSLGLLIPFFVLFSGVFNLRGYLVSETLAVLASGVLALSLIASKLLVFVLLWSLGVHGWLLLTRSASYGYSRTLSAIMFASGPLVFLGIPCLGVWCGSPFISIWCFILAVFVIRAGQETSTATAVLANTVSFLCLIIVAVALYLVGSTLGNQMAPVLRPLPPNPAGVNTPPSPILTDTMPGGDQDPAFLTDAELGLLTESQLVTRIGDLFRAQRDPDIDPKKREALAEESKRLMEQLLQRRSQDELN